MMFINEKKLAESLIDRIFERGQGLNICERLLHRFDMCMEKFNDSQSRELLGFMIREFASGLAERAVRGMKK